MRPLRQFLALYLTIGALAGSGQAAESIDWETDLSTATERAKVLNRPLLLHFFTDDCAPCRRLDETVFTQAIVQAAMQDHFVPVRIDANQHPDLATRYRVTSVPHDVILTPSLQEVHRMISPLDPEQYLAQLSAAAFRAGTFRSTPLAPNHRGQQPGSTEMDRHWSDAGRDPGRPDPRFHDGSPRPYATPVSPIDSGPQRDHSYAADRGGQATPDASPHEVINRFAQRGQDDPVSPRTPDGEPASPAQEPMARASRWGNWDQSAGADAIAARSEDAATHSPVAAKDPASDQFDARGGSEPEGPGRRSDGPLAGTPAPSGPAHPPLGLDGFCPVSLVRENRWTKGDARFGVIHRGRTYLFAGPEEKEIFFADPDEYSPVLAGVDPVELTANGQTLEGRRAHGVVYQKRVYLFTSEQNLQQFWEEPERYARPIRQAMENGEVGRLFR